MYMYRILQYMYRSLYNHTTTKCYMYMYMYMQVPFHICFPVICTYMYMYMYLTKFVIKLHVDCFRSTLSPFAFNPHTCTYIQLLIHVHVYMYIHVHCNSLCTLIYIIHCVYKYMYMYIYIHVYTSSCALLNKATYAQLHTTIAFLMVNGTCTCSFIANYLTTGHTASIKRTVDQ